MGNLKRILGREGTRDLCFKKLILAVLKGGHKIQGELTWTPGSGGTVLNHCGFAAQVVLANV